MKDFMYNSLPEVYRILDVNQKLILKRFLEAIEGGGLEPVLNSIIQFADSNNVDELDEEGLRLLGRTFGYEYNYILPIENQRKLIKNIVEIYKRKGTTSSVIYAAKEITGFDTQITHLHSKMFRTWSHNKHYEIPGYEQPRTYHGIGNTNAHCFPGTKFSKTNVLIKLIPLFDIGLQYERSTALQEVLKMLLPVYTKTFLLLSHTEKDLEDKTCNFIEHFIWDNIIFREDGVLTGASDIEKALTKIKKYPEPKTLSKSEVITHIIRMALDDYLIENLVSRTTEDAYLDTLSEAVEENLTTESLHHWQQNTNEDDMPSKFYFNDSIETRTKSVVEVDTGTYKTKQTSESGLKRTYLSFDPVNSDSCFTQNKIGGAGAKTIEMIVTPIGVQDDWDRIIQRANDDGYGFSIRQVGARFFGQFREFNGGAGECFCVKSDIDCDLTGKTDYHIILTWDGSTTPKMYINKVVQTLSEFDTAGSGSGNGLFIARRANEESYFWKGRIRHVAIWNKVMNQTNVNNRTNSPYLQGNEANLLGYWAFDERTGTLLKNKVNPIVNSVQNFDFNNGITNWLVGCWTVAEPPVWVTNGQGVEIVENKSYGSPRSCKLVANRTTQYFTQIRQLILFNQTQPRSLKIKVRMSGENIGSYVSAGIGGYFHYTDGTRELNPGGIVAGLSYDGLGTFDWTEKEFTLTLPKPLEYAYLEATVTNTGAGNPEAIIWVDSIEVIQQSPFDLTAQGTWETENTIIEASHSDYITRKVNYQSHTNGPSGSNFGFSGLTGVTDRNTIDAGGGNYTLSYSVSKFRISNVDYVSMTLRQGVTVVAQSQDIPETQAGDSFIMTAQNGSGIAGTVSQGAWSWNNVNGTITFILA